MTEFVKGSEVFVTDPSSDHFHDYGTVEMVSGDSFGIRFPYSLDNNSPEIVWIDREHLCQDVFSVLEPITFNGETFTPKNERDMKADHDKLRYDLVPPFVEKSLAQVMTPGCAKYGEESWKIVENGEKRYLAALKRHLNAFLEGETHDTGKGGMGYHHLKNCLFNVMAMLYLDEIRDHGSDVRKEVQTGGE